MYILGVMIRAGQHRMAVLSRSGETLTSGWSPSKQSSYRRHRPIWSPGRWAETGWSADCYLEENQTKGEGYNQFF